MPIRPRTKTSSLNTVSHFSYAALFQDPHFWQKCLNWTFSMIIYLLTFYLFDDIEKISESLMRIILLCQRQFWQNCKCNLNVYIFYLRFAPGIIHGDRCCRKTPKTIILFNGNTVTFWRIARFDVILTSVTIIKQVYLWRLWRKALIGGLVPDAYL